MAVERETFFLKKQKEDILQQTEAIEQQYNREFFSPKSKENLNAYPRNSERVPARNTQDDSFTYDKYD